MMKFNSIVVRLPKHSLKQLQIATNILMIILSREEHYGIAKKFHPEMVNQAERGRTKPRHLKNLLKKPARSSLMQLDEKDLVITSD